MQVGYMRVSKAVAMVRTSSDGILPTLSDTPFGGHDQTLAPRVHFQSVETSSVFPAVYAEDEALFTIDTLQIIHGEVPRRVRALVVEWATLHNDEIATNWDLARRGVPLQQIEPLE
jgi:Domain of unknown function (DUF4160)